MAETKLATEPIAGRGVPLVMPRRRYRLALAISVIALVSCEKGASRTTWDEVGRPAAAVTANRAAAPGLRAPSLLAHVPADTPFVLAALDQLPPGYLTRVCDEMCPVLARLLGADSPAGIVIDLIARGELGLAAATRWVVYGLGTLPVARIDVSDPVATSAAVARLLGAATEVEPSSAQRYWHRRDGGTSIVAGLIDRELVVAVGATPAVELALPIVFGKQPLGASMADGAALRELAAVHGFAGYGVGFVAPQRMIDLQFADGQGIAGEITRAMTRARSGSEGFAFYEPADLAPPLADPPPTSDPPLTATQQACRAALTRGAVTFPRIAFGFDELVAKRLSFTIVLEAESALAKRFDRAAVAWPALSTRVANRPLAMVGAAAERAVIEPLLADLRAWIAGTSAACEPWWVLELLVSVLELGPSRLPGAVGDDLMEAGVFGAVATVQSSRIRGGLPQGTDGYVVLGASRPAPVLAALQRGLPGAEGPAWLADGTSHSLALGPRATSMLAAPVEVGGSGDRVVLSAGRSMRARAEAASASPATRSPLLLVVFEVGKAQRMIESWLSIAVAFGGGGDSGHALLELSRAQQRLFGLGAVSIHATPRGLEIVTRLDLR